MTYDVLVVDPPWSYGNKHAPGQAHQQYATLGADNRSPAGALATIDAIHEVAPIEELAKPTSALYLWVTNTHLELGFELLRRWRFTYKTTLTWIKTGDDGRPIGGGMGWFYRGATEHVLFGTRGGYAIPPETRCPNVIMAHRSGHSAKPEAFYDMVEATSPNQVRIDVFARRRRFGWDVWGNEA